MVIGAGIVQVFSNSLMETVSSHQRAKQLTTRRSSVISIKTAGPLPRKNYLATNAELVGYAPFGL